MKQLRNIALTGVVAIAASLFSCGPAQKGGYAAGRTVIACDKTFQNVMEQEVRVFEFKYPGSEVMDLYVDEYAAIDSLMNLNNHVRMAVATRPLSKEEIKYLNDNKRSVNQQAIAVDAVALIVNPENPLDAIDNQDLIDILTGKITEWNMIPGAGKELKNITVVFDHQGSSTTRYMIDSLLNGQPLSQRIMATKTPAEVFNAVSKHKNAIGIIGASWLSSDMSGRELSEQEIDKMTNVDDTASMGTFTTDIKVLAVQPKDDVQTYLPTQYNIFNGKYPYHRQVYLISTCTPNSTGHSFYTFVTSAIGQKIILSTGICPKVITPQFVEL